MKKITATLVLTLLLLLPTLPVRAADVSGPGFFDWLQSWLHNTMSWIVHGANATAETNAEAPGVGIEEPEPVLIPLSNENDSTDGTEQGPGIDPAG